MNEYTQNSKGSTLEFSPRQKEFLLVELSNMEKHQEYNQIKNLNDRMQKFDSTLTTKQTEHAGLPFLPINQHKEEGNGN